MDGLRGKAKKVDEKFSFLPNDRHVSPNLSLNPHKCAREV